MTEQIYMAFDYETRSECDLKACGAFEYSKHPTTRVLCVAWRIGTRKNLREQKTFVYSPYLKSDDPATLIAALKDPTIKLLCHNATFENVITHNVFARQLKMKLDIPVSRWQCTAAQAAALALPRWLEGACNALDLSVKKDMEGRRLMLKYCKPKKPSKKHPGKWHNSATELRRIMQYCKTDIDAEVELFLTIPPLNPTERKVWELDQKINLRGVNVDRETVIQILKLVNDEMKNLSAIALDVAGIFTGHQREAILDFVKGEGFQMDNLQAGTVREALKRPDLRESVRQILELRQATSKTSTAKFRAFAERSRFDGRCRDTLMYHGASTGRWTASGVQLQNLPRGTVKDLDTALKAIKANDIEWIRTLYDKPLDLFSSCIRPMIIPSRGKEFIAADYSAIEARVLFWIAEHEAGLKAYRTGTDLYKHMALKIYGVRDVEKVTKDQRELGKRAILGCGYGMGKKKFHETCANQGQPVAETLAAIAVDAYREAHAPVCALWKNLERAAINAVLSWKRGKPLRFKTNKTAWWVQNKFLICELPSGRRLSYYDPLVKFEPTPWGEPRPKLYHYGMGINKHWELQATWGGTLTENVVQATARDLMAAAMLRIDEGGQVDIVLTVHDEILCEQVPGTLTIAEFENIMIELPPWAIGAPIKAEGWKGMRYQK